MQNTALRITTEETPDVRPHHVLHLDEVAEQDGKLAAELAPFDGKKPAGPEMQNVGQKDRIIDAVGPESFTYRELVTKIGEIIGRSRPIVSLPDGLAYCLGWILGKIVGDMVVTREEIEGLKKNLIHVDSPPAGSTRLTEWARENASRLGVRYASELARRIDRKRAYRDY